ncbi:MAG: hypothetical protein RhofKO_12150 [Rhodothermales bacterium]
MKYSTTAIDVPVGLGETVCPSRLKRRIKKEVVIREKSVGTHGSHDAQTQGATAKLPNRRRIGLEICAT